MPGRNVTLAVGVSGSGKTTFALRYLVNAELSARFMFDPDPGEFHPEKGEFADRLRLEPARDPYELSLGLCRGWIPFDTHTLFPGRIEEAFNFFCEWAWEKSLQVPGHKILVVDEAWAYQTPHGIPAELQTIVQSGRKRGLHLMVLSQEPNRFHSSLLNGVSEFVCFRLQSPPALELVRKYYGFDPAEISGLAPMRFVARNCDSGGELRGTITL